MAEGSATGLGFQIEKVPHFLKQTETRTGPHFSIVTAAHFWTNWNLAKVSGCENWRVAAF